MTRPLTHYYHPANLGQALADNEILDGDFYLMGGREGTAGGGDAKRAYYSAPMGIWIRRRADGSHEFFDIQYDPEAPKEWSHKDTTSYDLTDADLKVEYDRLVQVHKDRMQRMQAALTGEPTSRETPVPDDVWNRVQELEEALAAAAKDGAAAERRIQDLETVLAHKEELLRDAEVKLDQQTKRIEELEDEVDRLTKRDEKLTLAAANMTPPETEKLQAKYDKAVRHLWEVITLVDQPAMEAFLEEKGYVRPKEKILLEFEDYEHLAEKDKEDLRVWLEARGITGVSFS